MEQSRKKGRVLFLVSSGIQECYFNEDDVEEPYSTAELLVLMDDKADDMRLDAVVVTLLRPIVLKPKYEDEFSVANRFRCFLVP